MESKSNNNQINIQPKKESKDIISISPISNIIKKLIVVILIVSVLLIIYNLLIYFEIIKSPKKKIKPIFTPKNNSNSSNNKENLDSSMVDMEDFEPIEQLDTYVNEENYSEPKIDEETTEPFENNDDLKTENKENNEKTDTEEAFDINNELPEFNNILESDLDDVEQISNESNITEVIESDDNFETDKVVQETKSNSDNTEKRERITDNSTFIGKDIYLIKSNIAILKSPSKTMLKEYIYEKIKYEGEPIFIGKIKDMVGKFAVIDYNGVNGYINFSSYHRKKLNLL